MAAELREAGRGAAARPAIEGAPEAGRVRAGRGEAGGPPPEVAAERAAAVAAGDPNAGLPTEWAGSRPTPTGRRKSAIPVIEIARAAKKAEALEGLERWKARHPEAAARARAGRHPRRRRCAAGRRSGTASGSTSSTCPEADRPPQEPLEVDYDPWAGYEWPDRAGAAGTGAAEEGRGIRRAGSRRTTAPRRTRDRRRRVRARSLERLGAGWAVAGDAAVAWRRPSRTDVVYGDPTRYRFTRRDDLLAVLRAAAAAVTTSRGTGCVFDEAASRRGAAEYTYEGHHRVPRRGRSSRSAHDGLIRSWREWQHVDDDARLVGVRRPAPTDRRPQPGAGRRAWAAHGHVRPEA